MYRYRLQIKWEIKKKSPYYKNEFRTVKHAISSKNGKIIFGFKKIIKQALRYLTFEGGSFQLSLSETSREWLQKIKAFQRGNLSGTVSFRRGIGNVNNGGKTSVTSVMNEYSHFNCQHEWDKPFLIAYRTSAHRADTVKLPINTIIRFCNAIRYKDKMVQILGELRGVLSVEVQQHAATCEALPRDSGDTTHR
jgi:hypothetical protein